MFTSDLYTNKSNSFFFVPKCWNWQNVGICGAKKMNNTVLIVVSIFVELHPYVFDLMSH